MNFIEWGSNSSTVIFGPPLGIGGAAWEWRERVREGECEFEDEDEDERKRRENRR